MTRTVFLPSGAKVVLQGADVWVSPYRFGPDGTDHLYEQGQSYYRRNLKRAGMDGPYAGLIREALAMMGAK